MPCRIPEYSGNLRCCWRWPSGNGTKVEPVLGCQWSLRCSTRAQGQGEVARWRWVVANQRQQTLRPSAANFLSILLVPWTVAKPRLAGKCRAIDLTARFRDPKAKAREHVRCVGKPNKYITTPGCCSRRENQVAAAHGTPSKHQFDQPSRSVLDKLVILPCHRCRQFV